MKILLLVGIGSFLGGVFRYLLSSILHIKSALYFPLGTLTVNIIGCFIIGLVYTYSQKWELSQEWRLFLTTGLLGGFTTFSAFSIETIDMLKNQHFFSAFIYIVLSVSVGLTATALGVYLSK